MSDTWWVGEHQLNDEQKGVIALPAGGKQLICGPPGSGKTNLLLLRANYLTLDGHPNLAIVVFTRLLRDFIASGGQQYEFRTDKIVTIRQWQSRVLYEAGEDVSLPDDFQEQRNYFVERISELIERRKLSNLYDTILLDEAQDYTPAEMDIFERLGGNVFAVADLRQKIYKGSDCIGTIASRGFTVRQLRYHYRSGLEICKVADALGKVTDQYEPLTGTCNYDENARPSRVEHFRCQGPADEAKRIVERLTKQVKAYPDELLGVVCPTRSSVEQVWSAISSSDLGQFAALQGEGESVFEPGKSILVSTLHSAKGLEVRAMHIAGCEMLRKFPHQRGMAFTAVTRAKTSLDLYYSGDIPGYLEQALQVVGPPRPRPKLTDAFRGNR